MYQLEILKFKRTIPGPGYDYTNKDRSVTNPPQLFLSDPSYGERKPFNIMLRKFSDWSAVGAYDVKLKVHLKKIPTIKVEVLFKVYVMYPCENLHDGFPDGFWLEKFVSSMAVFVGGQPLTFDGNLILSRGEYVKFLHGFDGVKVSKNAS